MGRRGFRDATLEKRVESLLADAGWNDADGVTARKEILLYGEKAVPPLMRRIQELTRRDDSVKLILEIETQNPGAILRNLGVLEEVVKNAEYPRNLSGSVQKLLSSAQKALASDDDETKKQLISVYCLFTGLAPGLIFSAPDEAVMKLLMEPEYYAKEISVLAGPVLIPSLLEVVDSLVSSSRRADALALLKAIDEAAPGSVSLIGGTAIIRSAQKSEEQIIRDAAAGFTLIASPADAVQILKSASFIQDSDAAQFQEALKHQPEKIAAEILKLCEGNQPATEQLGSILLKMKNCGKSELTALSLLLKSKDAQIQFSSIYSMDLLYLHKDSSILALEHVAAKAANPSAQSVRDILFTSFREQLSNPNSIDTFRSLTNESSTVSISYLAALGLFRLGEFSTLKDALVGRSNNSDVVGIADIIDAVVGGAMTTQDAGLLEKGIQLLYGSQAVAISCVFLELNAKDKQQFSAATSPAAMKHLAQKVGAKKPAPKMEDVQPKIERAAFILSSFGKKVLPYLESAPGNPITQAASLLTIKKLIAKESSPEKFAQNLFPDEMNAVAKNLVTTFLDPGLFSPDAAGNTSPSASEARPLLLQLRHSSLPTIIREFYTAKEEGECVKLGALITAIVKPGDVVPPEPDMLQLVSIIREKDENKARKAAAIFSAMGKPALTPLFQALEQSMVIASFKSQDSESKFKPAPKQYKALAGALSKLIEENGISKTNELAPKAQIYLKRISTVSDIDILDGTARLLVAIGKPDSLLAELTAMTPEGGIRCEVLKLSLACIAAKQPELPEATQLLPLFAQELACKSATRQQAELDKWKNATPSNPFTFGDLDVFDKTPFLFALAAAGEGGMDALLSCETGTHANAKLNIAVAAATVMFLSPDLDRKKSCAKFVPFASHLAGLLGDSSVDRAMIKAVLENMGLAAVNPIADALGIGLESSTARQCVIILEGIAANNKGAPELKPAIPFFVKHELKDALVNSGQPAITPLLKAYKKNPKKAKWVTSILQQIAMNVKNLDTGVVAESKMPDDVERVFARHGLNLTWHGDKASVKPIKVKA